MKPSKIGVKQQLKSEDQKTPPLPDSIFNRLRKEQVHVEKKIIKYVDKKSKEQKSFPLSYVSWTVAHERLFSLYPDAKVETKQFPAFTKEFQPIPGMMVPYLESPRGIMVEVSVSIPDGKDKFIEHTVQRFCLEQGNNLIEDPDGSQIQDNLSRAFAKCCAKHGIGLYAYMGEDLPKDDASNSNGNGNGSNGNGASAKSSIQPYKTITEKQQARLFAKASEHSWDWDQVKVLISKYGYKATEEIEAWEAYSKIIKDIEAGPSNVAGLAFQEGGAA
jgi:hypothetical protein